MSVDTLPQSSIPITSPLRPRFGFLTSTPIIATATVLLALIIIVPVKPYAAESSANSVAARSRSHSDIRNARNAAVPRP